MLSLFRSLISVTCLLRTEQSCPCLLALRKKEVAASPDGIDFQMLGAPATCFRSNVGPSNLFTFVAMDIQHHALEALRNINLTDNPFDAANAVVFVLGHNNRRTVITEYPDVYVALDTVAAEVARVDLAIAGNPLLGAKALGVLTCGWAAPIGRDETPPSCHPERRRVRLAAIATTDLVIGSMLEFKDTPDEPIFDDGSASGSLRDALLDTMRAIVAYQTAITTHSCDD